MYQASILDIPYGGNSLETVFSLTYAPDIGVEVNLNLASQYSGVRLSHSVLNFTEGVNELSFRVIYDNQDTTGTTVSRGSVIFSMSGVDSTIFYLSSTTLYFNLIAADSISPVVQKLTTYSILKNSATIRIRINEPAMVYYMCSLNGTAVPPFAQVRDQTTAPYNTTLSQYGSIVVTKAAKDFYFTVSGLYAQTPYILHIFVEDRGYNLAATQKLIFTTSDRYSAADFSLRFQQLSLTATDQKNILIYLSNILTVDLDRLQVQKYTFSDTSSDSSSRMLSGSDSSDINSYELENPRVEYQNSSDSRMLTDAVYAILYLQIASNRTLEYYPSPVKMANSLNNKTTQLKAAMSTYDSSYSIIASAFVSYKPSFISKPTLLDTSWTTANFTVTLDKPGFVYISAISVANDTGTWPYPDQIYWGYRYDNQIAPSGSAEISEGYTSFNVTLSNLTSNTNYYAYVIAGSVHPGYPDLMSASKIVRVTLKTLISPDDLVLDINSIGILTFNALLLMLAYLL